MKKPFKETKFAKLLGGAVKVVIGGVVDGIPGGETLVRLISKTPDDQESTNKSDFGRFLVVVVIGVAILGVIIGKLSPGQLDGIIESLGK